MKRWKSKKQLKAENRELWEKLKAQNLIVIEYLALLELGDCNCCAKNRTNVCAYVPRPGEQTRINCPHFTKAVIRR